MQNYINSLTDLPFQVKIHHTSPENLTFFNLEERLFHLFLFVDGLETIVRIKANSRWLINSIYDYEATAGFIIFGLEPSLNERYDLTANVTSTILKLKINTEAADKHRRICSTPLRIGHAPLYTVANTVGHPMRLDAVVGQSECRHNCIWFVFQNPAICFSEKFIFIKNRIFSEEFVKIIVAAFKLTAIRKNVMVKLDHNTIPFQNNTVVCHDFRCQGKTNSFDRLRKSRNFCSSSSERRGVGLFAFSSANRSNSIAASPQSSGDDLIAVAISIVFLFAKLHNYNQLRKYDV